MRMFAALLVVGLVSPGFSQDAKGLKIALESAGRAGGKVLLRFTIENDSDNEAKLPEPADYLEGLCVKDESGKTIKEFGKVKDVKREISVAGHGFIGRTLDVSAAFKLPEEACGDYTFVWKFMDAVSNEQKMFLWREQTVTFETNQGSFTLEVYPDAAPITVKNFLQLCKEGFYNGLTFHRIIAGFMMQGGCPKGDGTGNSPHGTIKGEFGKLKHEEGIVAMARTADPDSASCQFFVCFTKCPFLDGQYASFGKVIDGMDTIHKIEQVKTDHGETCATCGEKLGKQPSRCCGAHHADKPVEAVKIVKVTLKEKKK